MNNSVIYLLEYIQRRYAEFTNQETFFIFCKIQIEESVERKEITIDDAMYLLKVVAILITFTDFSIKFDTIRREPFL